MQKLALRFSGVFLMDHQRETASRGGRKLQGSPRVEPVSSGRWRATLMRFSVGVTQRAGYTNAGRAKEQKEAPMG